MSFYMTTYRGTFHYDALDQKDLRLDDIAHALSLQCRFNGHIRNYYSVSEHCVMVARRVDELLAKHGAPIEEGFAEAARMTALLHDASEAYVADVPRPLKQMFAMDNYRELENRIHKLILTWQGVPENMVDDCMRFVKRADDEMLATEAWQLLQPADWMHFLPDPLPYTLECWGPDQAEQEFFIAFADRKVFK